MVECGSLENCFRVTPNGGSNPPLSVELYFYFFASCEDKKSFVMQGSWQPKLRQHLLRDCANTPIDRTSSLNMGFIRHNWNNWS